MSEKEMNKKHEINMKNVEKPEKDIPKTSKMSFSGTAIQYFEHETFNKFLIQNDNRLTEIYFDEVRVVKEKSKDIKRIIFIDNEDGSKTEITEFTNLQFIELYNDLIKHDVSVKNL